MGQRDITKERYSNGKPVLRRFHQARWDEPIIFELSRAGQRGILVPEVEEEIRARAGDVLADLPDGMRRKDPPALPELSQPQVVRHYARLSQENLGADLNVDIGQGTCTMKYSPKINDQLAANPKLLDLHPFQDEETVQGILEVMYRFEQILKEISGLDRFSLQPGAGSAAIYANVSIIRAYHEARSESKQRDEIITTIFSHPSNAACAKTAGYRVITLYPDDDGPSYHESGGYRDIQPEDRRVRRYCSWGRRTLLIRPGQRQRGTGDHQGPRGRLRPLPLQPP
jgi:glycine dehydrogenase subunit 2